MTMAKKSKVESSPHYNEIVDLLLSGQDCRYVSDYLLNKYNEKISHTSICKFKKEKLNVKAAAKKKIIEKEKKKLIKKNTKKEATKEAKAELSIEAASTPFTKNYDRADEIIESLGDTNIQKALEEYKNSPDYDKGKYVELELKAGKLRLEYMKYQTELFDEDELNVNVNDNRILGLSESLEKSRQKYLQEKENK